MFEIQCFDPYGNTINNLTQWDIDQSLVIPIDSVNMFNVPDASNDEAQDETQSVPAYAWPEVHFSNKSRSESLVVRSEGKKNDDGTIDNKSIVATIPNILLQDACPLQVYVYITDSKDVSSQKTILCNEIPIRKRQKPSDYSYVENIDYVTADMIKREIKASVSSVISSAITEVNSKKSEVLGSTEGSIDKTLSSAMSEFKETCETIVNDATAIKGETEKIKSDTKEIYNSANNTITENVTNRINSNGIELKVINNEGNVTVMIAIPDEEEV